MPYSFLVISAKKARIKRGSDAEAMLHCPRCGKDQGVFLGQMKKMKIRSENIRGKKFQEIVWERWQCLFCRKIWIEKYGIMEEQNGNSS